MFLLKDTVNINADSKKIFKSICYVFESSENYRKWNKDHISCEWEKGISFQKDSILYAEELLHGKPHKMRFKIIESDESKGLKYKLLFPFSIICPEGSFYLIPGKESTINMEASLSFRIPNILKKIFTNHIESIKRHMYEEGIELKRIAENENI